MRAGMKGLTMAFGGSKVCLDGLMVHRTAPGHSIPITHHVNSAPWSWVHRNLHHRRRSLADTPHRRLVVALPTISTLPITGVGPCGASVER